MNAVNATWTDADWTRFVPEHLVMWEQPTPSQPDETAAKQALQDLTRLRAVVVERADVLVGLFDSEAGCKWWAQASKPQRDALAMLRAAITDDRAAWTRFDQARQGVRP